MSISDPRIKNPVTKFYEFQSEKKRFVWFNKDIESDNKEDKYEVLKLPCYFVVVDELSKVTGYSKKAASGVYSNEVHSVATEPFLVRTFKGGYSAFGLWRDIKGEVSSLNGNFAKSVYAMVITNNESGSKTELVNITFETSSLGEWMDFKYDAANNIVAIMDTFAEKSNGGIKYNVPMFKTFKMKPEMLSEAVEMDVNLLKPFFKSKKEKAMQDMEAEVSLSRLHATEDATTVGSVDNKLETSIENKQFAVDNGIPEPDDDLPF